ncbi:MAG: hypothetical protein KAU35_05745 [candidate division Zixibacteria bacterium]|nr:hypothetical protein [candidate division Zixibacteria bacterium]
MRVKKIKAEPLTLRIEGKKITAEKFLQAASGFFGLLRNVADEISGQKGAVTWLVSAREGSQILTATPEADRLVVTDKDLRSIPRIIHKGLRGIQAGSKRPTAYSDTALWHAKELAAVIGNHDGEVSKVSLVYEKETSVVSEKISEHVDDILGSKRTEEGSVEGRVSLLSDKKGQLRVGIDDVLTGHSVKCKPRNVDETKLINAFRNRVVAIGTVHYRRDGMPVKIDVDRLRVLGKRSDLPGFDDVIGIFRRGD